MPAVLGCSGRAVPVTVTQAFALARKEAIAQTLAGALGFAETLTVREGVANALRRIIAKTIPHPKVIANPKILPDAQADPRSET